MAGMIDMEMLSVLFLAIGKVCLMSFAISCGLIYVSHIVYSALELFTAITE